MKTLNINEIVESAKSIAKERGENIFFNVRGNIIEGCRNRKTSEEYEFNAEDEKVIYDDTRNEVATSIILEAIDLLKDDSEVVIEFEESEEIKDVETSSMNINPCNEYFLRFTNEAEEDLRRGTSLFKTGSMNEAIELKGLCGFNIDLVGLSKSEIEKKIARYAGMFSYYSQGCKAVIFEGETIESNKNGEGVVFKPYGIEGSVKF
ncbi:MAG: hypothetical protein ACK5LF_17395 [Bacteroides xylanisolvens]